MSWLSTCCSSIIEVRRRPSTGTCRWTGGRPRHEIMLEQQVLSHHVLLRFATLVGRSPHNVPIHSSRHPPPTFPPFRRAFLGRPGRAPQWSTDTARCLGPDCRCAGRRGGDLGSVDSTDRAARVRLGRVGPLGSHGPLRCSSGYDHREPRSRRDCAAAARRVDPSPCSAARRSSDPVRNASGTPSIRSPSSGPARRSPVRAQVVPGRERERIGRTHQRRQCRGFASSATSAAAPPEAGGVRSSRPVHLRDPAPPRSSRRRRRGDALAPWPRENAASAPARGRPPRAGGPPSRPVTAQPRL